MEQRRITSILSDESRFCLFVKDARRVHQRHHEDFKEEYMQGAVQVGGGGVCDILGCFNYRVGLIG